MTTSRLFTIIGIACLLCAMAATAFLLWPKIDSYSSLRIDLKKKELELRYKDEYFRNLQTLSQNIDNYSEDVKKIDTALPTEYQESIIGLGYFLGQEARKDGLLIDKLDFKESAPPPQSGQEADDTAGKVAKANFEVEAKGTYTALKTFLESLYKNSRMIELDSLTFSTPLSDEDLLKAGISNHNGDIFDFELGLSAGYFMASPAAK